MTAGDGRRTLYISRNDAQAHKAWRIGSPVRRSLPLNLLSQGIDALDYPIHAIDDDGGVMTTTGESYRGIVTLYVWHQNIEARLFVTRRANDGSDELKKMRARIAISEGADDRQIDDVLKAFDSAIRVNLFRLNDLRNSQLSSAFIEIPRQGEYAETLEAVYV